NKFALSQVSEKLPYLETLLLVGVAINSAAVLTSDAVQDEGCVRYLTPSFIYMSILLGRCIAHYPIVKFFVPLALVLTCIGYVRNFHARFLHEPQVAPHRIHNLNFHLNKLGLEQGFADYWD